VSEQVRLSDGVSELRTTLAEMIVWVRQITDYIDLVLVCLSTCRTHPQLIFNDIFKVDGLCMRILYSSRKS
jgi:hypothetical protein